MALPRGLSSGTLSGCFWVFFPCYKRLGGKEEGQRGPQKEKLGRELGNRMVELPGES